MYEFDWSSIIPSLPYLLAGLVITLKITVTAVVVGNDHQAYSLSVLSDNREDRSPVPFSFS